MSDIFGSIIGDAQAAYALIGGTARSIGTVLPNVAVEEVHHDTAALTQHPTETGSPVTDHMFLMPQMVELRWGWSDSAAMYPGYSTDVYNALLDLQRTRKGFPISTAKRQYTNMQIVSLTAKTDMETENAFMPIAVCQQVITVDVQTTAGSSAPNTDGNIPAGNTTTDAGAAKAANLGYPTDSAGNVTMPGGVQQAGTVYIQGQPTAPQFFDYTGGLSTSAPASFADTTMAISNGAPSAAYPADITGFNVSGVSP